MADVSESKTTSLKRRAKSDPWQAVRDRVAAFAAAHGLAVVPRDPSPPQYQIACLIGEGVRLVVYPHTTKFSGGQHARIRNENSRDRGAADRLMALSGLWIRNKGAWTGDSLMEAESDGR